MAAGVDPFALLEDTSREMRCPPTPPDELTQQSRLDTPPMQMLPSPEYTPPGGVAARSAENRTNAPSGELTPRAPILGYNPTSRTESFVTAREESSKERLDGIGFGQSLESENGWHGLASMQSVSPVDTTNGRSMPKPRSAVPEMQRTPGSDSSQNADNLARQDVDTSSTPPSMGQAKRKQERDTVSESGTASSHGVRPKVYQDDEMSPLIGSGSSHDGFRPRTYQTSSSVASPLIDHGEDWDNHVSYMQGENAWLKYAPLSPAGSGHGRMVSDEQSRENDPLNRHVSYISFGGEGRNRELTPEPVVVKSAAPLSARLRGKGSKRIEHSPNPRKVRSSTWHPETYNFASSGRHTEPHNLLRTHSLHRVRHLDDLKPQSLDLTVRKRCLPLPVPLEAAHVGQERWELSHLRHEECTDDTHQNSASYPHNTDELDIIYRHIRNANMNRYDALKSGVAIAATVTSTQGRVSPALRRMSKCQSLRTASEEGSVRGVHDEEERMKIEDSPLVEESWNVENLLADYDETRPKSRAVSEPAGPHKLRREKRCVSNVFKNRQKAHLRALSANETTRRELQDSPIIKQPVHRLRHASTPIKKSAQMTGITYDAMNMNEGQRTLRRVSRYRRVENIPAFQRVSLTSNNENDDNDENYETDEYNENAIVTSRVTSPNNAAHYLDLSPHQRMQSVVTIDSTAELCEASNVKIFPHSNKSVTVIQTGSRPTSKGLDHLVAENELAYSNGGPYRGFTGDFFTQCSAQPTFALNDHDLQGSDSNSDLPAIRCIPPTPSSEHDRQLVRPEATRDRRSPIASTARRISQMFFHRNPGSGNHEKATRDETLHPYWRPIDDYSSESDFSVDQVEQNFDALPAGGDTSEHPMEKKGFAIPGMKRKVVFVGLRGLKDRVKRRGY